MTVTSTRIYEEIIEYFLKFCNVFSPSHSVGSRKYYANLFYKLHRSIKEKYYKTVSIQTQLNISNSCIIIYRTSNFSYVDRGLGITFLNIQIVPILFCLIFTNCISTCKQACCYSNNKFSSILNLKITTVLQHGI